MDSWTSYPSIYNLGHPAVDQIKNVPVIIEEKIDGSQFSAGIFGDKIRFRSKRVEWTVQGEHATVPDQMKMFSEAIRSLVELPLHPGWTYRFEYLQRPKHNVLEYARVPNHHLIVLDIATGPESYLPYQEKARAAWALGLEVTPLLYQGLLADVDFDVLLAATSILGPSQIEGLVIKTYELFGRDKKPLFAKLVSDKFREEHKREWKTGDKKADNSFPFFLQGLVDQYNTEMRWQKAYQHLRDDGLLDEEPRDIPKLLKEVTDDVLKECREEITTALFDWTWPRMRKGLGKGLAEWYKAKLYEVALTGLRPE